MLLLCTYFHVARFTQGDARVCAVNLWRIIPTNGNTSPAKTNICLDKQLHEIYTLIYYVLCYEILFKSLLRLYIQPKEVIHRLHYTHECDFIYLSLLHHFCIILFFCLFIFGRSGPPHECFNYHFY